MLWEAFKRFLQVIWEFSPNVPLPITGASRWLLTPTGTLRTSRGYKGLDQISDGGEIYWPYKGMWSLIWSIFFSFDSPRLKSDSDHPNTVNSHYFNRGECDPLYGQYFCPPLLKSLIWSIYSPPPPIIPNMVNILSVHPILVNMESWWL